MINVKYQDPRHVHLSIDEILLGAIFTGRLGSRTADKQLFLKLKLYRTEGAFVIVSLSAMTVSGQLQSWERLSTGNLAVYDYMPADLDITVRERES